MIKNISKVGPIAGVACFAHCCLMPILIAVLPAFGLSFLLSGWFELGLMGLGILIPLTTMCIGFKRHKSLWPFCFMVSSALWWYIGHQSHHHFLFLMFGGLTFLAANILNHRLCRSCSHGCNH